MGLFGDILRGIGGAAVGFMTGGPLGAIAGGITAGLGGGVVSGGGGGGGVVQMGAPPPTVTTAAELWAGGSQGLPTIEQATGVPSFLPALPTNGEIMPVAAGAAVPVIMGLTRTLALSISRLAARLGITVLGVAGLSRVGLRIWRSLVTFTRRHPNISVLSMLTALGLTVEEASEFIAWGSTRRRRRRGGISARDIRICRRTMRRITAFQQDLGGMRRAGRRPSRLRDGVVVARAG